ncbi:Type I restriction modification DNA specificity domain-containing protein [Desulfonatronum zhilinae]|nr:Type I restriction modification DNA specificity domain-containing protein [Desulfonatronum zhilinae]
MTLETFFDKFNLFADAPGAVGKMRELVLELALRGKLVPQNDTDESASELLKRIRAEKKRRQEARVIRTDEEAATTSSVENFEIPASWEWIGATAPAVMVSDKGKKIQTKAILETGKYPVVDQGKVFIRGYCNDIDLVISVATPLVLFGDHTRETKLIDFDFVVGADGVKLLLPVCIDPQFYYLALRWLPLESRGYARHFKLLKAANIPLPPLAEQQQIVAKVDELMALCDRLETQQRERDVKAKNLLAALVAELTGTNNGRNTCASPAKPTAPAPRPSTQPVPTAPSPPSASATPAPSAAPKNARTLAELRKAVGLSQSAVAKAMGLNQAYISQMETGKRAISKEQRCRLAEMLGVIPDMIGKR